MMTFKVENTLRKKISLLAWHLLSLYGEVFTYSNICNINCLEWEYLAVVNFKQYALVEGVPALVRDIGIG